MMLADSVHADELRRQVADPACQAADSEEIHES